VTLLLGWLFLCAGGSVAIAGLGAAYAGAAAVEGWAGVDWGLWIFSWMWQPHAALISIAVLAFPDGRFEDRWRRGLACLVAAVLVLSMVWSAIAPEGAGNASGMVFWPAWGARRWAAIGAGPRRSGFASVLAVVAVFQAAVRYSLMSPAQVVCRWIGSAVSIAAMALPAGARCRSERWGRCWL